MASIVTDAGTFLALAGEMTEVRGHCSPLMRGALQICGVIDDPGKPDTPAAASVHRGSPLRLFNLNPTNILSAPNL